MSITNKKTTIKTVDFVPEFNEKYDFKKVSEYDFAAFNSKLIPVIALISMEKGTSFLYPDMGVKTLLMDLPYTEEPAVDAKLALIKSGIEKYCTSAVNVSVDSSSSYVTGEIKITIEVNGVPGALQVSTDKSGLFNIQHPSIYKK